MSLTESLGYATLGAGARMLNTRLPTVGTPLTNFFDMPENEQIEPGHKVVGNILYKREVKQNVAGALTVASQRIIDPFAHYEVEWKETQHVINIPSNIIRRNLGGVQISELETNTGALRNVPSGSRNTLFNQLAKRLINLNDSTREDMEQDFLVKSIDEGDVEGPDGIDVITEPDGSYGGIGYQELGEAKWKSDLLGVRPYLWNPLTRDYGSTPITLANIRSAARDLQKMSSNLTKVDPRKAWTVFAVSPLRYEWLVQEWFKNRRITNPADVEMGPTAELKDSVLRIKFISVPMMTDDNIIYFWQTGVILRAMQRRMTPRQALLVEKVPRQHLITFSNLYEYQFVCSMPVMTGWLKGPIGS